MWPMADLLPQPPPPLAEQIADLRREIALRERVYPGFVARRLLSERNARRQVAIMWAVLATLAALQSPAKEADHG